MNTLDRYLIDNYEVICEMALTITRGRKYDAEELAHEVIVVLYDADREKMEGLIQRRQMRYWIARIMLNQYNSSTSPYHYKYRKPEARHRDAAHEIEAWSADDDGWEGRERLCTFVEEQLANQPYFERMVFQVYVAHNHSLNTLAEATGISRTTLYKAIKKIRYAIQEANHTQGQRPRRHH